MTEETTVWVHGCNFVIDSIPTVGSTYRSITSGLQISSTPTQAVNISVMVAIPTPSVLLGNPIVATTVLLKFKTSNAEIYHVGAVDGASYLTISVPDPLTSTSFTGYESLMINPPKTIQCGMALEFGITVKPSGYIQLLGAGTEFQS